MQKLHAICRIKCIVLGNTLPIRQQERSSRAPTVSRAVHTSRPGSLTRRAQPIQSVEVANAASEAHIEIRRASIEYPLE